MRDRADFMENLKQAQVHLMILREDIKYTLSEERQKLLDGAYLCLNHLFNLEMKDDLTEVLKSLGKKQEDNT